MMPRDSHGEITTAWWNVLRSWWTEEDLTMVRGGALSGSRLWHEVDMVLIPCNIGCQHWLLLSVDLTTEKMFILDPFRQDAAVNIQKAQVAPLHWFLLSMLHQVRFHTARPATHEMFANKNKSFSVSVMFETRIPQQKKSSNYVSHTLRLIEYLLADRKDFDWSEDDMGIIREKIVIEIFYKSRPV
ncbi:hypothetical protein Ddye_000933 [Dipteronia dyeriana]|uniref:Ubiquitin-like protease family profile domain-containing protein n=1 Tax=Dipteronia dyeriana TaxID=168575 RepID=A0AAD9XML5_9ROSI|nr:hypothetical protein Ddye_000933 [Dipteronia dyeriana]